MKKLSFIVVLFTLLITSTSFSQDMYMYVSDAGNFNNGPWQILRYNVDGSNPQVLIDNNFFVSENVGWPQDIVFLESEDAVLISHLIGGRITKHNATTGVYIEDFAAVAGGPTRMEIGDDNLLYVLQWSNSINKVVRFQLDGTPAGEYTDIGIPQSIGMDWDSAGNFYVSSFGGGSVSKFDSAGTFIEIYAITELSGPTNLWFDDNDHLFVLDWNAGNVEEYDQTGLYIGTWTTGLPQGEGVDFLPNGNALIGNGGNASVDQFMPDGTFIENTVPSGSGDLLQPNAVVLREVTFGLEDKKKSVTTVLPTVGTHFDILSNSISIQSIEIFDVTGRLIETFAYSNSKVWDASQYPEGLYLLTLISSYNERFTHRVVVKK